jgi:hypothetical protein
VDAPLSMYLQPGSSTSSVQGYRCPTAQVLVNSHRLHADYSHDARLDVPRRPPLQPLTKVRRGPVAGLSGCCVARARAVSARRSPRGECSEHGATHVRMGPPSRASRGAVWPRRRRRCADRRLEPSDPCIAIRASAQRGPAMSLQRETLGAHASKRALGTSRLAQFDRGLCTVRLHSSYRRHSASSGADVGARAAEPSKPTRILANLEPVRDAARRRVP